MTYIDTFLKNRKRVSLFLSLFLVVILVIFLWFFNKENSDNKVVFEESENAIVEEQGKVVCENDYKIEEDLEDRAVVIHDSKSGDMSKSGVGFVRTQGIPVDEFMYSESDTKCRLDALKEYYKTSEGLSQNFGYFPIIFYKDTAYSGFNEEVKADLLSKINPQASDLEEVVK